MLLSAKQLRVAPDLRGEGDEVVRSFALVTTDTNAPMQAVHDRMLAQ